MYVAFATIGLVFFFAIFIMFVFLYFVQPKLIIKLQHYGFWNNKTYLLTYLPTSFFVAESERLKSSSDENRSQKFRTLWLR